MHTEAENAMRFKSSTAALSFSGLSAGAPGRRNLLFKLCQHVGHDGSAFNGFVDVSVGLEQGEHVPAVLHGQASDQLLHHLEDTPGEPQHPEPRC